MKKNWKRVGVFTLALIMVTMLLPISSFKAQAEKGEDDSEVLGATYKVGDIIKFGHYEQDGNTANGKEEIEWQVIKVEGGRVLVLSRYILDCKTYHETSEDVTWETCDLRKWLNNDFKNEAFTSSEQAKIPTVTLVNKDNPYFGTPGGKDTQDQIFCLSTDEVKDVIGYNHYDEEEMVGHGQKLLAQVTKYALSRGADEELIEEGDYLYRFMLVDYGYSRDVIGLRTGNWWLRSPGSNPGFACFVSHVGTAGPGNSLWADHSFNIGMAVRPALYISAYPDSIKLDKTSAVMYYGDSLKLSATLKPSDVMDKTVTWTSSNPDVVTVNNGTVKATGKKAGTATVTAKTTNGLSAKCEVTVFADNNPSNIFADIKADSWMYIPAKAVYDKGYMTGTGTLNGRVLFSPNTDMNRTMFVQALYSMDGKPDVTYEQKFSDVIESAWYAKAVTWASNNSVVAGNADGTFGVNGKATREQLAQMFYKYAVSKGFNVDVKPSTTLDGFTDANKVDSWALTAVKWAVERGIISGKGNASTGYRIDPTGKATRVECAAMMNKFSEIYANPPKMGSEDLEEPLALPEEDIVDVPVPADETEDVIIDEDEEEGDDEDVPSKDEKDTKEEEIKDEPAEDNEK